VIPLFNLKPNKTEVAKYLNVYKKNLLKADFIQGQQVKELEKALSNYTKIKYVQTCANGTDALEIAMKSLNLKKNTYVITTPFSWISTAHSIINSNLRPLFVDISLKSFNLDYEKVKLAYSRYKNKVSCVLSVDIFGNPNNNNKIYNFCKSKKIKFIVDGAQSFGSKINGMSSFKFCDIATTSFFPTKPLGCYGDGGAIFTKSFKTYKNLHSLAFNGKGKNKNQFITVGINSRLDTIQASLILKKLKKFDSKIFKLKKNYLIYKKYLNEIIQTQQINLNSVSSYALTSIIVKSHRNKIISALKKNNISCSIYYKKLLSDHPSTKKKSIIFKQLKNAKKISSQILSVPNYENLKLKDLKKIIKIINLSI
jgi:UDP-2-acetamido-2-deoxy-ribo-hexuluronate aminotransferase